MFIKAPLFLDQAFKLSSPTLLAFITVCLPPRGHRLKSRSAPSYNLSLLSQPASFFPPLNKRPGKNKNKNKNLSLLSRYHHSSPHSSQKILKRDLMKFLLTHPQPAPAFSGFQCFVKPETIWAALDAPSRSSVAQQRKCGTGNLLSLYSYHSLWVTWQ